MSTLGAVSARVFAALSPRWPYVVVSLAFLLSRILYRVTFDVRFDTSPVEEFIQYIGPWFVEHDFLRSLLYLHQQPPLQNLLTGGCVRLFGAPLGFEILHAVYVLSGATVALGVLHVMIRLGVHRAIAASFVVLYAVSPVTVFYENWLFYHEPVAALHVLALLALLRYYRLGTFGAGLTFFALLAASALFYSLFAPVLVFVGLALFVRPPLADGRKAARTRLAVALAIPLAVVGLDRARTRILVGHEQGAAYFWMNLAVKTFNDMRPGRRDLLIESGEISRAPQLMLFSRPLSEYDKDLRVPHAPTGVPLLDLEYAPDGSLNAHALEKVLIAESFYKRDALYLLRHAPDAYWRSFFEALTQSYFHSPLDYDESISSPNRDNLSAVVERTNIVFLPDQARVQRVLLVLLPLALLYGLHRLLGSRGVLESERSTGAVIVCSLVVVSAVTLETAAISFGDFCRYRYNLDPYYLILLSLLATDFAERARRALRDRPAAFAR
jgi:hypothetical protein